MKLYFVRRWGNDSDPNGEDTNFIVRAADRASAVEMTDEYLLINLTHERVQPFSHNIVELGADGSGSESGKIILGPWYSYEKRDITEYLDWVRDDPTDDAWTVPVYDLED